VARRRDIPEELGDGLRAVLHARWMLCVVAGYLHRNPATPAGVALADLYLVHKEALPAALDAYREARDVLEAHDELRDFEAFQKDRHWCAGHWPNAETQEMRVRAV
jgi:hypothetical protein